MSEFSPELGSRLRALRHERGYSLAQVAKGTEISKSFVTLVEGGKSDITITRLMRLTRFYGVHIADVLPNLAETDEIVVRKGEGQHVYSPAEKIDVHLLSKYHDRALSPIVATFAPNGESEPSTHDGEEFLYVLNGKFELQIGDDEPIVIKAGDSAHFRASRSHTYKNVGDADARMLSIVTPAVF